ncbi:MAG: pentapeptide repeat-containing protein [Okeania sp. SIO2C9]|uniref:pentapeptide repeat-containing protein n=1 Tax=Okeania sp. SIO2C9 TaxID=2607791 RepID=UPI0013C248EE|nr:pentapeptide repeat-containing protein [Okeania sp. SIO2C9]NEQ71989.1 pentapeptide repeat-containing protein [Okeania sp. SIO2C9]
MPFAPTDGGLKVNFVSPDADFREANLTDASLQNADLMLANLQGAKLISCPVASVLYSEGKEEGRRKREEGLKA